MKIENRFDNGSEVEFVESEQAEDNQCRHCFYNLRDHECPTYTKDGGFQGLICDANLHANWQPVKRVEKLVENPTVESWPDVTEPQGKKYDAGKQRYDLIPALALDEVVRGLTVGAAKYNEAYDEENWRKVDHHDRRYFGALQRHSWAVRRGETNDPETGVHHYALAICNLMFLLEKELEKQNEFKETL